MERRRFLAEWLIDGSGAPIKKNILLTVENGIISEMVEFEGDVANLQQDDVDFSYCTILPPLIDCHAHLALSGSVDSESRKEQLLFGYDRAEKLIQQNLHYNFSHGVFAVRDAGDKNGYVSTYCSLHGSAQEFKTIIKSSGSAWYRQGHYGSSLGQVMGSEIEQKLFEKENSGDFIKVINSGVNSLEEFAKETKKQFSTEELSQIVGIGNALGKPVMVHANGADPVKDALDAGCSSIEHGFFMGEENLRVMAEKGVTWVPTVYAMQACGEDFESTNQTTNRKVAEKTVERQLHMLAKAKEFGVTVAVGTDSGSIGVRHGESLVLEMKMLLRAGYSLVEVVHCATQNGARLLGMDSVGHLAVGKPATFIVARATPAMLMRKLAFLEAMYIEGEEAFRK